MVSTNPLGSSEISLKFAMKNSAAWLESNDSNDNRQTLGRQNTMEFLGSLLKGADTPEEPLPQLFEGLSDYMLDPSRASTPMLAASENDPVAAAAGIKRPGTPLSHQPKRARPETSGGAAVTAATETTTVAVAPEVEARAQTQSEQQAQHKETGPSTTAAQTASQQPPASAAAPASASQPAPSTAPAPSRATTTTTAAAAPVKKAKNPKRADRRRTIARFTTAILRAGGSNAFIARDGLGYRKAFDRFLVETYGDSFAEGGYWYENARVEPFFRVLFHVATDGRINVDEETVNGLFCKREKRQAAEWLLDEQGLAQVGVTATELAAIFEGPPRTSPTGFPRGTPLALPKDVDLDGGAAATNATRHQPQPAAATTAATTGSGGVPPPAPNSAAAAAAYLNNVTNAAIAAHHTHAAYTAAAAAAGHHAGMNLHFPPPMPPQHQQHMMPFPGAHARHHPYAPHAPPLSVPPPLPNALLHMAPSTAAGTHEYTMSPAPQLSHLWKDQTTVSAEVKAMFEQPAPQRMYSSDLSRLISDFNANPTISDEFLKSYLARTASELDVMAGAPGGGAATAAGAVVGAVAGAGAGAGAGAAPQANKSMQHW